MSKWISVKERLPEHGETVLVFNPTMRRPDFPSDRPPSGIRLGHRVSGGMLRPDGCIGYDRTTTHWMPLPEPPEEPENL